MPVPPPDSPPVHLIATGGTIASTGFPAPRRASRDGRALLADAGVTGDVSASITVTDVETAGSYAMGWDDLRRLHAAVTAALDAGAAGVVVTHGTDTMEESAYGLDLLLDDRRPVVLTGAQRAADEPGADGPGNLRAALEVAADPEVRGDGVLLCFDGEVFAARGVAKRHTLAAGAFDGSVVHRVVDGRVRRVSHPVRRPALPLVAADPPRVDVVAAHHGADGTLLRAAVAAGARGVVLAAVGIGNAAPDVVAAVGEAVAGGVTVLLASRVAEGPVSARYATGGTALVEAGARPVGEMSPWQARMLLGLALAAEPGDPGALLAEHLT
ncbi:asparaginase domain-containing protein [Actinomycetospora straminea]|uniref:asparaginase n=1 Tax=Actinomycetospora straminea TaxID=663607 RepID=A0ABP9DXN1_9PSEU|nr:asparaginase domain-containing protein [Actinomycetospora straminea]MDD7932540.1 asparaginase domain-containing protein [Actinomycetospora straminea]